jgi:hypothetical protein
MRSRAGRWLVVITAIGVAAGASGVAGAQVPLGGKKLTVTPARGGSSTRFVVQFSTAYRTGTTASEIRAIEVRVSGPRGAARGCTDSPTVPVSVRVPGLQRVTLSPGAPRARWCLGTFSGSVEETIRPNCRPGLACPQFIAIEPLGTFSFVVR